MHRTIERERENVIGRKEGLPLLPCLLLGREARPGGVSGETKIIACWAACLLACRAYQTSAEIRRMHAP